MTSWRKPSAAEPMMAICSSIDLRKPSSGCSSSLVLRSFTLRLVHEGLGVVEVVLEERLGLLLVGVDEGLGDLLLEDLEVLLVEDVLQELEVAACACRPARSASFTILISASRTLIGLMQLPSTLSDSALSSAFMMKRVEMPFMPSRLVSSRSSLDVDLLGLALLDDLLAVVELELGHQVALRRSARGARGSRTSTPSRACAARRGRGSPSGG